MEDQNRGLLLEILRRIECMEDRMKDLSKKTNKNYSRFHYLNRAFGTDVKPSLDRLEDLEFEIGAIKNLTTQHDEEIAYLANQVDELGGVSK